MIHVCETSLHPRVCLQEVKLSLPALIDYSVQLILVLVQSGAAVKAACHSFAP